MKLKKLLVLGLLSSLMMIGCASKAKPASSSVEEPTSSEVTSSEPSEPETPSEPEVVAKTIEEVVDDINGVFNPLIGSDLLAWYEDYSCFIGGLNLGAAEHATDEQHASELQEATEFVVSYLPEYLEVKAASFEEEYDDYYIGLSVDEVSVDLFGYVNDSGNIIVQIQVA